MILPRSSSSCALPPVPAHGIELLVVREVDAVVGIVAVTENGDQIEQSGMPGLDVVRIERFGDAFLKRLSRGVRAGDALDELRLTFGRP